MVAVCGRLQVRNWEDKQGQKRRSYEVVAEEVHFAESKKDAPPRNDNLMPGGFDLPPIGGNDFTDLNDDDGELPF